MKNTKRTGILSILVAVLTSCNSHWGTFGFTQRSSVRKLISFTTIVNDSGFFSPSLEKELATMSVTFKSPEDVDAFVDEYAEAWSPSAQERIAAKLKSINYPQQQGILVALSAQKSGGYSVSIASIEEQSERLLVLVEIKSPPPGEIITLGVTYPCHFVSIKSSSKPVEFSFTSKK